MALPRQIALAVGLLLIGSAVPAHAATLRLARSGAFVVARVSPAPAGARFLLDGRLLRRRPGGTARVALRTLRPGRHRLVVRARHSQHVLAAAEFTRDVRIPRAERPVAPLPPPAATFAPAPRGATAWLTWTVRGRVDDVACSFDGGAFVPCASPTVLAGLSVGAHTVTVQATNVAGVGSTTASWIVVATPPTISLTSAPRGTMPWTTATIAWTTSGSVDETTCSIEGGAYRACASPLALRDLAPGDHRVAIRVANATGSASTHAEFSVRAAGPAVSLTSAPSGSTSAATATLAWSATADTTSECSLDGATFAACSSPTVYAALHPGVHVASVRVRNAVGTALTSATWVVVGNGDGGSALAFAPPHLVDPTVVNVGPAGGLVNLDPARDYIVRIGDVRHAGGVILHGGRNVVAIGGHITIPWVGNTLTANGEDRRALMIDGTTGTVHVEGLLIDNTGGDLSEGIQINAPNAIVQIEDVRVDGIHARDETGFTDNHPDLIQPWGGVRALRVDHFSGSSDYQGLFLRRDRAPIGPVDLRNVALRGTPTARYLFWQEGAASIALKNVFITPNAPRSLLGSVIPSVGDAIVSTDGSAVSWPARSGITGAIVRGTPPGGDFVPAASVGVGYVSPGYAAG